MDEVTPEEALLHIENITADLNGAYHNQANKFTARQQSFEIAKVNRLRMIATGSATDIGGFVHEFEAEKQDHMKAQYGHLPTENFSSSNVTDEPEIDEVKPEVKSASLMERLKV